MATERAKLHPAEHRAYRELYAASRQLIRRWQRVAPALEGTPVGDGLKDGAAETSVLLTELAPRTATYGLYGGPTAQGMGARIADLRTAITDRGGDTGLVVRSAVLDIEHVTTLLRHLAELARARSDRNMAGFCQEWAARLESSMDAVRQAAVELGADPDRASAPLGDSVVNRATHGVGWVFGSIGEAVDRVIGSRRG
ncbi:MAG TPA: hypothetical protein VKA41_05395 [Solirubrobacterales bacterium]|nr:hypothetical protein [Solirubrobacterales bacterium]